MSEDSEVLQEFSLSDRIALDAAMSLIGATADKALEALKKITGGRLHLDAYVLVYPAEIRCPTCQGPHALTGMAIAPKPLTGAEVKTLLRSFADIIDDDHSTHDVTTGADVGPRH